MERQLKRRKVRRGTHSCWQCKRRKVRCSFADATETTCDGCRSRQVKCIKQDVWNTTEPMFGKSVHQSTKQSDAAWLCSPSMDTRAVSTELTQVFDSGTQATIVSPADTAHHVRLTSHLDTEAGSTNDQLVRALLAAWPSQPQLDLILTISVPAAVVLHGIVCVPYSSLHELPSPKEVLSLSSADSHPVLLARKLLTLASYLQGIPPGVFKHGEILNTIYLGLMHRAIETASRLVTSNDALLDSIEGIECVMIESMFQNNAGNLHRAWSLNRRAMTLAQMMGLHSKNRSRSKVLATTTRERIKPEYMWFRLVMSDRYLSLMLGLPQGWQEGECINTESIAEYEAIERMERMETFVAGRILQRQRDHLYNLQATNEIDTLLKDAASSMPANWWLSPDIATTTSSDEGALHEMLRITNQFAHYHLLLQLHLPYLLRPSADQRYNYSKITAINASREIISRFMSFGGSDVVAYCRGVDFIAFIASTALCLAYIDMHRQCWINDNKEANIFAFLGHQRLGDRGLMELMLRIMKEKANKYNDNTVSNIAVTLQRLLAAEESAATGDCHNTCVSSYASEQVSLPGSSGTGIDNALEINIPHLGIITIGQGRDIMYTGASQKDVVERTGVHSTPKCPTPGAFCSINSTLHPNQQGQIPMVRSFPPIALIHASQSDEQAIDAAEQIRSVPNIISSVQELQAVPYGAESFDAEHGPCETACLPASKLTADIEDWAFEGVGSALFDNLFEGWVMGL